MASGLAFPEQTIDEIEEGTTLGELIKWMNDTGVPESACIWLDKGREDVQIYVEWDND